MASYPLKSPSDANMCRRIQRFRGVTLKDINLKVFSMSTPIEEVSQIGLIDKQAKDVDEDERNCKCRRKVLKIHEQQKGRC